MCISSLFALSKATLHLLVQNQSLKTVKHDTGVGGAEPPQVKCEKVAETEPVGEGL